MLGRDGLSVSLREKVFNNFESEAENIGGWVSFGMDEFQKGDYISNTRRASEAVRRHCLLAY